MAQIKLPNSSFSFLSQGAIIQEFRIADHNVVLGFSSPEPYFTAPYFGETIGRVANRISDGLIGNLNGRSYQLATNLGGENHLHGGTVGWGHRTFSSPQHTNRNGRSAVRFTYISPDGEEGYPGTVELRVWYTAYEDEDHKSVLEVEYEAELVGGECEETVINITNHSYFNLGIGPNVEGTEITLSSNRYLATDSSGIPTTEVLPYEGIIPHQKFVLGATAPAVDSCFVMDMTFDNILLDTRSQPLRQLASAFHPSTNIHLEVLSTEPSFQFYTGDFIDVPASEHGTAIKGRAGFCVEPGRFINAVNVPQWRDQVVLGRNQTWGSKIVYQAWKA